MSAGMDDDAFVEKFVRLVQTKMDERCDGPHKLHDAFKYFDRMGKGRLDVSAFRAACERLMIHLTDHEAQVGLRVRAKAKVGVRVGSCLPTHCDPLSGLARTSPSFNRHSPGLGGVAFASPSSVSLLDERTGRVAVCMLTPVEVDGVMVPSSRERGGMLWRCKRGRGRLSS